MSPYLSVVHNATDNKYCITIKEAGMTQMRIILSFCKLQVQVGKNLCARVS